MPQQIDVPGHGVVEFPDGMTDDQIVSAIKANPPSQSWGDVAQSAASNLIPSTGHLISGLGSAIAHPLDTVGNILNVGAGELRGMMLKSVQEFIDKLDWNPEITAKASAASANLNSFYKDRYGSEESIKSAIANDPAGVLADASTVLGGGGALASRIPGLAKVGDALTTASNVTNPINAAVQGAKGIAQLAGSGAKVGLALTTQTGASSIEQAAKAGYAGDSSFMDNLKGNVPMTDVLDAMKQNLQNMSAEKSANYRQNMAAVSNDKTVLNFNDIDTALSKATNLTEFKGEIKNPEAAAKLGQVAKAVSDWKNLNPAEYHTPEGLDALKQSISGVLESIPYQEKTARNAVGQVYSAIKNTITTQAPTYANTMKEYSDASDQIREIEKTLSLNPAASVDTAMRKLQSLMRNNVHTNYGSRLDLAQTLQDKGGNNIMPALAGQAMNSWTPRGLGGQGEALATLGAGAFINPHILAALPFQSPKIVGSAAYGAGKLAKALRMPLNAARNAIPINDQQAKLAALLLSRANQ